MGSHHTSIWVGEEIMRQGWPANQVYFIRSGYVDLIMNKAVVDTLRDGDFFGEAALMELPSQQDLQQVSSTSLCLCQSDHVSGWLGGWLWC